MNDNKEKEQKKIPKYNKNKKRSKIILVSVLVFFLIVGVYIGYTKYYLPETTEYTTSIYKENNILIDDLDYKEGSYIQVLNENGKVEKKIELNKDSKKIILKNNNSENVIDTWIVDKKIDKKEEFYKRNIIYFNIKPIYKDKEDFILTFKADDKAKVLEEKQEAEYIKVPYKKGINIENYLPDIKLDENFKGDWTIDKNKINKDIEIKKDTNLNFITYQDKNNNNVDDFTEEFTIKFETNIEEKVKNKVVKWEDTINLPILKDNEKVFYEWYLDKEFKEEFTEETKITKDLILYAKVKNYVEVINEAVDDPIKREDIVLQLKPKLDQRNKKIDDNYNKEIKKIETEREELKKYNQENNIMEQKIETQINLHNKEHDKIHLVNFVDTSNKFIYSLVAPYGQTIKVINEEGNLYKEYGVRHNTTIRLDENKLLSNGNQLSRYHSEYRKINDTVFIKIQPIKK